MAVRDVMRGWSRSAVRAESEAGGVRLSLMAALTAILAAALWTRFAFLDAPVAGFHLFNEGFYTNAAMLEARRGILSWLTQPGDFNNPPLYTLVVSLVFRAFGPSVVLARAVSAAAGVVAVFLTFLVGKALFSERIGLLAAAFLAVLPGAVLINSNAQVDSLFVALELAGIFVYVLSVRRKNDRLAFVAGALLGLALMTKLPAVLAVIGLAAWDTWRARGLSWLTRRRTLMLLGGFVAFGAPWHLVQLIRHGSQYLSAQQGVGSSFAWPNAVFWRVLLGEELLWMHWPPLAALVLAGLGFIAWKRTTGDKLLLSLIAVNLIFYIFFHMHTYYLLPLAPLTVLAAARIFDRLVDLVPRVAWPAFAALLPGLVLACFVMLAGQKLTPFSPQVIEPAIGSRARGADLWADPLIWGNVGPTLELSVPNMRVRKLPEGEELPVINDVARDRESFLVTPREATRSGTGRPFEKIASLEDTLHEVVVFGVAVSQVPPISYNIMMNGAWRVRWGAYPPSVFGVRTAESRPTGVFIYDVNEILGLRGVR